MSTAPAWLLRVIEALPVTVGQSDQLRRRRVVKASPPIHQNTDVALVRIGACQRVATAICGAW